MKGNIILVQNNEGNFVSEAIKFFTKRIAKKYGVRTWTHSMISVGELHDIEYVLSAELSQCIMPLEKFKKDKIKFEVYKIKDTISENNLNSLVRLYCNTYAGDSYGFLQLPWFCYRWFMEIFNKNVNKQKNWFPSGDICSEMVFRFLMDRLNYSAKNMKSSATLSSLSNWTENTIHPVDLGYVIKNCPFMFEKAYSWNC